MTFPMKDLAIDVRDWGPKFKIEVLFDYLSNYYRAGYKALPEKIICSIEQQYYLMGLRNEATKQPLVFDSPVFPEVDVSDPLVSDYLKPVEYVRVIWTPFRSMVIEVVRD